MQVIIHCDTFEEMYQLIDEMIAWWVNKKDIRIKRNDNIIEEAKEHAWLQWVTDYEITSILWYKLVD